MSDIITNFRDARSELNEYFGWDGEYHYINFELDDLWSIEDCSVLFGGDCEEHVGLYENDIVAYSNGTKYIIKRDKYTAIKCNDGCGNTDWYVFSNENRVKSHG